VIIGNIKAFDAREIKSIILKLLQEIMTLQKFHHKKQNKRGQKHNHILCTNHCSNSKENF